MPGINDLSNSNFLTQLDCEPPLTVTISAWKNENVAPDNQQPDMKFTLYFHDAKPLVLNKTNGELINVVHGGGDNFDNWIGKQITLYRDKSIMYSGKPVGGIRVEVPRGGHQEKIGNAMNQHNTGQGFHQPVNNQEPAPPFNPDLANAPNNEGREATGDAPTGDNIPF